MSVTRRTLGLGLLGASVAATGGFLYLKESPLLRDPTALSGFVGGEKKAFLANPRTVDALASAGFALNARQAGSVEMVRAPELLGQSPDFLWPSSSVMVEIARESNVAIRRSQVILNSPIVVYSWSNVVDGLMRAGLVKPDGAGHPMIDLLAFLRAVLADKGWADVGVPELFGKARLVSTDPNLSNSGFMFAGLVANLLSGDVATIGGLDGVAGDVETLFRRMGYKSHSSGSLFEDYLAGGPGAYPMTVGYESQLVEWIIADPERWRRVSAGSARPVALYPVPTVYSAHPLLSLKPAADGLIEALTGEALQAIAWTDHGFRGPLGAPGASIHADVAALVPERLDAIAPMPEAAVMLALLARLAA
ncbi:MAG: substrate-binding domain-containing protein [Zavarzinia sp.]|nr:substrate-binding domain-containing protein [Zavarzinia sp.]